MAYRQVIESFFPAVIRPRIEFFSSDLSCSRLDGLVKPDHDEIAVRSFDSLYVFDLNHHRLKSVGFIATESREEAAEAAVTSPQF